MEIIIKHLKKSYSDHTNSVAINDISFTITTNEKITAILGPSGSGKSTLLNLIAALDSPDSGEIIIDGTNIVHLTRNQLADYRLYKIGIIFQAFNLFPTFTVFENIAVPAYLAGLPIKEIRRRITEIADIIGIRHLLGKKPHQISGGESQRTAIARSLINNPQLLLADEPTGNLDSKNAETVFSILCDLTKKINLKTIIVTHDEHLVQNVCKKLIIKNGQIEE